MQNQYAAINVSIRVNFNFYENIFLFYFFYGLINGYNSICQEEVL